ncbi:MAG: O-methyltransferase [Candidatus Bathyarchaeia archaeon]
MSNANKVLKEIESMSERKFLPIVGPDKGRVLVRVIHEIKPKRVLEVGTLVGYSAILMAKELESDAHLITIEIHADEAEMARENIKKAEVSHSIDVLVGDAVEVIPKLAGKFDMVFIDAEKTEYLRYLQLVQRKLHRGSVVVADNAGIFADQMKDYLNYVRSSGKYRSEYVPFGEDGVEVSVKL